MNDMQIKKFVNKLIDKTNDNEIKWFECDIEELRLILRKVSGYSRIVGGFASESNKHNKVTVIGKYTVNYYYEEDASTERHYVFLAIVESTDYTNSIVFTEDEMSGETWNKIFEFYRQVELDVNNVSDIMDTWFDD